MSRGVFPKANEFKKACFNLPGSRNGTQPALRSLFRDIITVRVAYLVAYRYLPRSIGRGCTQADWDAADQQFPLVFFLSLLSDKRVVEISQNLYQIVERISRIEGLLQRFSSAPLQVTFVCAGSFQISVEAKVEPSKSK